MKILVFGNSGSGKSTFARRLAVQHGLKLLDLDHVVWSRTEFAKFLPDEQITRELNTFVEANPTWARWAHTILEQALDRLPAEFPQHDKGEWHDVLKAFEPGEQETLAYQQAAVRLGVTESAVKSMIHRPGKRHRELVREQIAHTVSPEAEVDEELRHLMAVISE